MENVNVKEVYEKFTKEYSYLLDNDCRVAGFDDANNYFEYLFRTNEDFVKFVQKMVQERGCCFDSSVEHAALMFTLDTMGILDYFD